jgi:hypothetical protein
MRARAKSILVNGTVLFGSIIFSLAAGELGFRILGKPAWKEIRAGWKYEGPVAEANEIGYRGRSIKYLPSDIVVVLLGDSQVESSTCPLDKMPEAYLERYLKRWNERIKVFTLGSAGYGNDQQLLALHQFYERYRADSVILWQTLDNDIWNNIFPTHWPTDGPIKPTYRFENGKLIGPNHRLGELIRAPAHTKIGVLINRVFHPQKGLDASWEAYLPPAYKPLLNYSGEVLTDWDPANPENKNPYLKDENLNNEKSHLAIQLFPRSERMQYGLDLSRALLSEIKELAEKNGSSFSIFYAKKIAEQEASSGTEGSDVIVRKRGDLFYQTSNNQVTANRTYLNNGFTSFEVDILIENWKGNYLDFHLNCDENDQAMRILA